ncbi:TPA: hypothetical protein HA235_00660 [Candidatus Woesearchaeota archaeon]|nr:hypothetical protein [Candidatus Woesearchaeota archaeon]HIH31195.1 hypothetical protein [Candidatus Woesearchaeota archaeon]HIH55538.1 hypothetical protein [Candidatus Woesearchaeota archaeon]HIJ01841.1 hypothetical protein [Candidatus Woesearchaeota archaeon]HIJ13134.1 hypothetical protein [Candidatus Woesearchaeota archaeon]
MNIEGFHKQIRPRQIDIERIKSILKSAQANAKVVANMALNDDSASVIFREIYESIRQLGDAMLWMNGYEPLNHEVSLDALRSLDIKNKILLNHLSRFKAIRNDINYRGFTASQSQAKEIIDFWKKCTPEIIEKINKEMK